MESLEGKIAFVTGGVKGIGEKASLYATNPYLLQDR